MVRIYISLPAALEGLFVEIPLDTGCDDIYWIPSFTHILQHL